MTARELHTRSADDGGWRETALRQGLILLLVSVLVTAVSWALRPDRLPLRADRQTYELELAAPLVQPADALGLYDEGEVLFADTRSVTEGGVIPGAFPLRPDTLDDDLLAVFDFLEPETPLVLYGDGSLTTTSGVAARLAERGYTDLRILAGGVGAWRGAGGELRPADPEEAP